MIRLDSHTFTRKVLCAFLFIIILLLSNSIYAVNQSRLPRLSNKKARLIILSAQCTQWAAKIIQNQAHAQDGSGTSFQCAKNNQTANYQRPVYKALKNTLLFSIKLKTPILTIKEYQAFFLSSYSPTFTCKLQI